MSSNLYSCVCASETFVFVVISLKIKAPAVQILFSQMCSTPSYVTHNLSVVAFTDIIES